MTTTVAAEPDLATLTALNRDYIASVQHGDVSRFEEILADDFLCSHPDGSLVDRKKFLEQTARPGPMRAVTPSRSKATSSTVAGWHTVTPGWAAA